jgi:hypothetical protein
MEYVIPAVIVLLLVAGFVTFLVLKAGQDETPLGDTDEHAGEQSVHGTTARDPEEARFERPDPDAAAHVARPGEGEGAERLEFEGERPAPGRDA